MRATATFAFLMPIPLASFIPKTLREDKKRVDNNPQLKGRLTHPPHACHSTTKSNAGTIAAALARDGGSRSLKKSPIPELWTWRGKTLRSARVGSVQLKPSQDRVREPVDSLSAPARGNETKHFAPKHTDAASAHFLLNGVSIAPAIGGERKASKAPALVEKAYCFCGAKSHSGLGSFAHLRVDVGIRLHFSQVLLAHTRRTIPIYG